MGISYVPLYVFSGECLGVNAAGVWVGLNLTAYSSPAEHMEMPRRLLLVEVHKLIAGRRASHKWG